MRTMRVMLLANTSWYIYNFRLPLAKRLRAEGYEVILVSPFDAYAPRLQEAGFRWIRLPLARSGLNPIQELRSAVRIFNIYRRDRPDLVHQFTLKCVIYGSAAASVLKSIRVLNSVTGLGYVFSDAKRRHALRFLVGILLRLTARRTTIVFQNPEDRAEYIRNGWTTAAASHLVRGSGVNLQRFAPRPRSPGTTTIVFPGRMLSDKGIFEFVDAVRLLRSRGLDFRAVLVGRVDLGNPASVPAEQLRQWSEEGVIEWWGWEEHMEATYAKAHIVCLPSYYREGVPMSLVEAAACGLPIVATDVPGCREIVRENVNGLLVPPRDSIQLAKALQLLLENAELQLRLGAGGREVAAEFASGHVLDEILGIYRRILEPPVAGNA